MGNCLSSPTADDISLLRGSDSPTEGNDSSSLGPPPPYQVSYQNIMIITRHSRQKYRTVSQLNHYDNFKLKINKL